LKLGIVSAALPQLSLDELAAWAASNQFETLELMCWPISRADRRYAGVTHIDVAGFGPAEADRALTTTRAHGLEISALGYYPNPLHPDVEHRASVIAHLRKVISAAALLGVPVVNTFVGRDKHKTVEANLEEFARVWPDIVTYAREQNVKIAIENCPMIFSNDEWPGGDNLGYSPAIW